MATERVWSPQRGPQEALIHAGISGAFPVIFFGGARGGGKTDAALGLAAIRAGIYQSGFNALFVRRELPMLDDAIERSKAIYGPLGATWHEQAKTWRFPGGGRLRFRPLERVEDSDKFQGQNLSDAYVEEAGQYPNSKPIDRLQAALRSAAGVPTILVMTGNPGGAGQGWIKARFVDPHPRGRRPIRRELPGGHTHEEMFIPSRIEDNAALLDADPSYISRLHLVGSEALVKAWLEGDWTAVEGAFFDGWRTEKHVVAPFDIPAHWVRYRSFDWGFSKPFSVGWWAVASEPVILGGSRPYISGGSADDTRGGRGGRGNGAGDEPDRLDQTLSANGRAIPSGHSGDVSRRRSPTDDAGGQGQSGSGNSPVRDNQRRPGLAIPRGALVRYREWYGASDPNVGIRLQAEDIAAGIKGREKDESIAFGVADPSIWAESGAAYGVSGPSIGERLQRAGVIFRPADNRRKQGWDQMRARLKGDGDGNPMLVVFDTCTDFIRTVPVLQHDQHDPEDLDTDGEDHAADEGRYACMARPWTAPSPQPERPIVDTALPTLRDLVKRTQQRNRRMGQRI